MRVKFGRVPWQQCERRLFLGGGLESKECCCMLRAVAAAAAASDFRSQFSQAVTIIW